MNLNFPKDALIEKEQRKAFAGYWLRRIFIDDWLLKLTALVITLALWLGVSGLQDITNTRLRNVSLNPIFSNQLEITNSPVQEVSLRVNGDKRLVENLNPQRLVVTLDLTSVGEGEHTIQITPENIAVDLPSGVKIEEIQPDKIAIKLEKVEEYDVPIKAETVGELKDGFEIYSTKATPKTVRVKGPRSFVESLQFVSTERIKIDERQGDFTAEKVALTVVNPKISLVDVVSANVFFRIGKKRIERLFVVPYETDDRVGKASVLLYGPSEVLEDLTIEDLQIVGGRNETDKTRLDVTLPIGLQDEVEIKSVKYRE